jgi:hypothetical protein
VRRWTRRFTLVALATLALAAAGHHSAHAACPTLDVACQLDEAISAGEGLVDDVSDPVDTPVDDVSDPVDTPVDDTTDPIVDPIVDDALDRVHDLLGGGPVDLPDPLDGGDGGNHRGGPPVGEEPPGTQSPADPGGRSVFGGRSPDGAGLTGPAGPTISAASGTAPPANADRTSGNRFGEALGGVARSLAIVLALFGLAVAFVTIQDRLDRSDPRLALAPVESDVVGFA